MPEASQGLMTDHEVRLGVLEQQHRTFEARLLELLTKSTREEESIHRRLDIMSKDIHAIPERTSEQLQNCRAEMREEIGELYAKKHEVVTPKVLIIALGLMASLITAGVSTTIFVMDLVDGKVHAVHEEYNSNND